ncbi:MAG TPA: hypothetical protein VGH43_06155 [Jatrophihabitans sp.]
MYYDVMNGSSAMPPLDLVREALAARFGVADDDPDGRPPAIVGLAMLDNYSAVCAVQPLDGGGCNFLSVAYTYADGELRLGRAHMVDYCVSVKSLRKTRTPTPVLGKYA